MIDRYYTFYTLFIVTIIGTIMALTTDYETFLSSNWLEKTVCVVTLAISAYCWYMTILRASMTIWVDYLNGK